MFLTTEKPRQPQWVAWSWERLFHEHAIALGQALDNSTLTTYGSHLQSYLTFCKLHDFPLEPTPDMLSFYVVFMAHHIKPNSVSQYLSGIVSSLEPHFPNVREVRNGLLVTRMLTGMRKLRGFTGITRKRALTEDDLLVVLTKFTSHNLDDLLMVAIIFTGFHALMRLGEMMESDNDAKWSFLKTILHHTVVLSLASFSFILPKHKADWLFEENTVMVEA